MSDFVLSCCSTADLAKEHFEARGIEYICFHYYMDDVEYADDLGQSMPFDEFYKRMAEGADTRTAQVNISEYLDYFTTFLEQGKDLLHVTLSSGISGSYQSACSAAMIARERYPERKVYVVDSLAASSGFGLLMDKLADKRDEGMDIESLAAWLEENRLHLCHWFTVNDLMYLKRGGRVSAATAAVGTMLNIKPVLHVDDEGHLISVSKVRGRKASIEALAAKVGQLGEGFDNRVAFISHGDCLEDAQTLAAMLKERYGVQEVIIGYVGAVIGSHAGPDVLALFFLGKHR